MNFSSVSPMHPSGEESLVGDSDLGPAPNYGTLGPGSNVAPGGAAPVSRPAPKESFGPAVAILVGVLLAGLLVSVAHSRRSGFANPFASHDDDDILVSARDLSRLDQMKPQKQAETLLELAVRKQDGAVDQISSRVDHWHGKLRWNSQISMLTTAAMGSSDRRLRESGVEIQIAAYGLWKNSANVDYLLRTAESSNHAQKIWALWVLGLMGNRAVEPERVMQALATHLKDSDEDSRYWSVEGLALTGANEAIPLLLQALHDDSSLRIRERAACAVAESRMFAPEQRRSAIPQLLQYTDDPVLDAQTHALAFRALGDITHKHLPNDTAAWRSWYQETGGQEPEAKDQ
jgi:hypothetical protein